MTDLIGQDLGRYHILELLGQGGMAAVYKAYDTHLDRQVAIKVLRTDLFGQAFIEEILKRFEREAKALAKLSHPNIVKVHDYGDFEGKPYLVMEYLPGGTLKDRLKGTPIPWKEALRILVPIAQALDCAHDENILHRDVKPSNILLTARGLPLLADFGIAKIMDVEAGQTLTATGTGIGTPEYMSPEQILGKTADGRADVYSLGIVLYEMVTGRKPFLADTPMAVLDKHLHEPLPLPSIAVPDLPASVENVILKSLAKLPEDRYKNMAEFASALEGLLAPEMREESSGKAQSTAEPEPVATILQATYKAREEAGIQPEIPSNFPPAPVQVSHRMEEAQAAVDSTLPAFAASPSRRRYWIGAFIFLGVACLAFWGIMLARNPGFLFPTRTPTSTQTPSPSETPTLTPLPTITETASPLVTARPTYEPLPAMAVGASWTRPVDSMQMVYVPGGKFIMGTDQPGTQSLKPLIIHTVYLDSYLIDRTDVTNAMYRTCVTDGNCQPPYSTKSYTRPSYYDNSQFDNYPVIFVDWNQAKAYCEWAGVRLPTEAEWEKATRGTDERKYPWGFYDPNCMVANFLGCAGDTTAVDAHLAGVSFYGVLDMAGNVWDWVADWYNPGYYARSPWSNPQGPALGLYKVVRGGGWDTRNFTSFDRNFEGPSVTKLDIGFRCARSAN